MITRAVLVHVGVLHLFPRGRFGGGYGFQHRDAVASATAKVIDLSAAWILIEAFQQAAHIVRVDIVADLLSLIAKHAIGTLGFATLHQIGQIAM